MDEANEVSLTGEPVDQRSSRMMEEEKTLIIVKQYQNHPPEILEYFWENLSILQLRTTGFKVKKFNATPVHGLVSSEREEYVKKLKSLETAADVLGRFSDDILRQFVYNHLGIKDPRLTNDLSRWELERWVVRFSSVLARDS